MSKFVGGISDGALVPEQFWILDTIDIEQRLDTGDKIVYHYIVNDNDHNWHLKGEEYVCEE